jgi:hypothetical protein
MANLKPRGTDASTGQNKPISDTDTTNLGLIQSVQTTTPSNPPAGSNKLYFKSDDKLYKLDSSGTEAEVGSGSGGSGVTLLATITGIDATATGTTNLYTVPGSTKVFVTRVILELTTVTAISGTLVAGVGVAAGEDDIFASTSLTGFDTTSEAWIFSGEAKIAKALATNIIKLGIDTAFSGTTATMTAYIFGLEV